MKYLLLLSLLIVGCGRGNSQNYHCNKEQLESVEKLVNSCAEEALSNKRACWDAIIKNVCTYEE